MIVGVEADAYYDSARASIPKGSGLYVFSDGVYEFRARDGSIFGIERFTRALVGIASAPRTDKRVLEKVLDRAKAESTSKRFPDDVSLLELRFG